MFPRAGEGFKIGDRGIIVFAGGPFFGQFTMWIWLIWIIRWRGGPTPFIDLHMYICNIRLVRYWNLFAGGVGSEAFFWPFTVCNRAVSVFLGRGLDSPFPFPDHPPLRSACMHGEGVLVQKDWTKHRYVMLLNIPISCYHYVPTMRGSTHFLKGGGACCLGEICCHEVPHRLKPRRW